MEQYEQPGGNVRSKVPSEEYKNNYDSIFRKDKRLITNCFKCGKNWTATQEPYCSEVCPNCGELNDLSN